MASTQHLRQPHTSTGTVQYKDSLLPARPPDRGVGGLPRPRPRPSPHLPRMQALQRQEGGVSGRTSSHSTMQVQS